MASGNKTLPTTADVAAFIDSVEHDVRRADAGTLLEMMTRLSGDPPVMWGASLVGFGQYHYKYDSGREGDFMRVGFPPRKANQSIYIIPGFDPFEVELARLGKHKLGRSCLYVIKLADIDVGILEDIIARSLEIMAERYPVT